MNSIEERKLQPMNGFLMLFLIILGSIASVAVFVVAVVLMSLGAWSAAIMVPVLILSAALFVTCMISFAGLRTVKPNEAWVFSVFGSYYGTLDKEGFWWVNPFASPNTGLGSDQKAQPLAQASASSGGQVSISTPAFVPRKTVSLKVQTFINAVQKVNDLKGNPVMVGSVVVWKITDPTKAVFAVDDYRMFLSNQADSIIRNVARLYPYDNLSENDEDENENELTLRGSSKEIAERMKNELQAAVAYAGIEVIEVRINQLSYSEEIASAMLQRQQAEAIIAARKKIVEGAVSMVEMALRQIESENICAFDDEKKAQMVSNLLVVLCGNKDAQPVLNSGSIY